jgi:signal transduction histidine kinase
MGLITASSIFVLLVFPRLFRHTLIDPLMQLLDGMRRVNDGDLDTAVPIRYHDEIGFLTGSFNTLTRTLKQSYELLEQRVADRTRELSAFSDLTMLSSSENDLSDRLQPAIDRILEAGRCQALCLHLLGEDGQTLHLAAYRYLPETAAQAVQTIVLTPSFATRIQQVDKPIISDNLPEQPGLPGELKIGQFRSYLGSPLGAGEQSHGWLSCYREDSAGFGVSEASLLVALARQLGVIVENQWLRQRIGQVAVFEERRRLARDLHDSVTQLLFSMTLFSRAAKDAMMEGDPTRLENNLNELGDSSMQALREMRSLLFELQPPSLEEVGLVRALAKRFDIVERRVGIRVHFQFDESLDIPRPGQRDLYFVAIEALNNVLKHAGADEVSVILAQENNHIQMTLTDNGRGFDLPAVADKGGLGLQNMRQRIHRLGGTFEINTAVGAGVRLTVTVPYE